MSQSSQARAPRRQPSKSPISPDFETTVEESDENSGERSPIDDSDAGQDYIHPQQEDKDEESLEESSAEGDDDLKAL